jgi:hypothetical protein
MVRIPHIKIPSVRVGGIDPTSDIGTAIGGVQPPPITYLTQWKIVGNSEVHTLPYPDGVVLPTGYKRCKYLQFHGTEYIDSGIIPEQGIEAKTKYLPDTDGGVVFGTRSSAWSRDSLYIIRTGTPRMYSISYGGKVADNMSSVVEEVEININSQSAKLNNTTIPITSTIIKGQNNLYIGGVNGLNLSYCYIGKIYFFKLSLNGADIFNGIPCLDANDVPCLYDTVSQTTLYNQGTGTFGYEIEPQPTEIWSCGEYSNVDSKYHVVVLPTGKQAVDIVLDEPLRKTGNTADTLEYPTETSGKALLTIRVEESGGELSPLDTPTTELVDAPQIEEAESYTCVISQGAKAVEWSSFLTD